MADLEDLYREIILDHYRSPRNRGELPSPPAHRVEGYNPLCGDEVVVTVAVEDGRLDDIKITCDGCSISQSSASLMSCAVKGKSLGEVQDLIRTFKTLMSVHEATLDGPTDEAAGANGSVRTSTADEDQHADGSDARSDDGAFGEPEAVDLASLGELAALQGVVKFPVRIKCATLSWNALNQALGEL